MKKLLVELGDRSYPIYIGSDLLNQSELYTKHIKAKQVAVVTNETIAPLYLDTVLKNLTSFVVETVILPDGEQFKTLEYVTHIFDKLLVSKFSRNATLIALGGGVIGDMGGFASSCYKRGIDFINIPTTLLAMADASVGGKTGIDFCELKNSIGTFAQPKGVFINYDLLNTLPKRHFKNGLAEIFKIALVGDKKFWNELKTLNT